MAAPKLFEWTPDQIEDLRRMWAEGLSCTEIAIAMGQPDGRSAIMGKVHRLKLQTRRKAYPRTTSAEKLEKARAKTTAKRQAKAEEAIERKRVAMERANLIPKLPKRETASDGVSRPPDKRYLDRQETWRPIPQTTPVRRDLPAPGCQWPVDVEGNSILHFCNQPRKEKSDAGRYPYCDHHQYLSTRRL